MCEHCGTAGRCAVCGHDANGPAVPQDRRIARLRVRQAEKEIEDARARIAKLLATLPGLRLAADLRPGDGSDQPGLFDEPAPPTLFG